MSNELERTLMINNKKYQIVWNYEYSKDMYLYLVNVDDYSDILFVKMDHLGGVDIVTDMDLLSYLIEKMTDEMRILLLDKLKKDM